MRRIVTLYWRLPLGQFWQCIIKKKGFRKEKGSFKKFLRLQNQHSNIIIIGGKYFVLQFEFFYWILLCKCILKILKITKYISVQSLIRKNKIIVSWTVKTAKNIWHIYNYYLSHSSPKIWTFFVKDSILLISVRDINPPHVVH